MLRNTGIFTVVIGISIKSPVFTISLGVNSSCILVDQGKAKIIEYSHDR
jgi:hypothetical protein